MQVPVKLRGADAQGATFEEETETLAINATARSSSCKLV